MLSRRYVYLFVDGTHSDIRLAEEGRGRQCILVILGVTEDGDRELVAIQEAYRETT